MTLPEHAICSAMLAQFGVRQRYGWPGVAVVTIAGISPDADTAAKLVGDEHFWNLHHALGHSLLSLLVLSVVVAGAATLFFKLKPFSYLFAWCALAALAHAVTDSLYYWGVEPFWPFSEWEIHFSILEYLDLFVLAIWLVGAFCLYRFSKRPRQVACWTLGLFAAYVAIRAAAPPPTGLLHLITGGWMYEAPQGTPVLDWW